MMVFKLYDAVTTGNQIGSTITTSPTLANGLFSVNLDFGAGAFNGSARWLDITVSNGVAQTLSPRVQVLPAPYAQFAAVAATVTNGAIMNAQLAGNAVATANIQNNAITTAQIANGAVTNGNLTANAVNATNIASGQVVKSLNGLTDNLILSAGANLALFTNGNTLQISAGVPNIQVFITNGTFTVPTNVARIMVEMWGGGGGGGSAETTVVCQDYDTNGNCDSEASDTVGGGGGGAGAYAWNVFNVTPGASYSVVAGSRGGNGGTSSFGNLLSAEGGSAGGNAGSLTVGAGGAGGHTTTGSLATDRGGDGSGGNNGSAGGGVWRGGQSGGGGPGRGGGGGGGDGYYVSGTVIDSYPSNPGDGGSLGAVIVYY
jgi:hypothetical protein